MRKRNRKCNTHKLIIPENIFDNCFDAICNRRLNADDSDDVWSFRKQWHNIKPRLKTSLEKGCYRFQPVNCRISKKGKASFAWSAQDSIVQKVIAVLLTERLSGHISKACTHLKGHGGSKKAVCTVQAKLSSSSFFFRADVAGYYQNCDHTILMQQLLVVVPEPALRQLIWSFLRHTIHWNGLYADNTRGLPMSSPISPLLGALYLKPLDDAMLKFDVFYSRFLDDWVILSKKRWTLKKAIRKMHAVLRDLKLTIHPPSRPDKTSMGRVERGFTFLGYDLKPRMLGVAKKTQEGCLSKAYMLHEQHVSQDAIVQYVKRWVCWAKAGIEVKITLADFVRRALKTKWLRDTCLGGHDRASAFLWDLCALE